MFSDSGLWSAPKLQLALEQTLCEGLALLVYKRACCFFFTGDECVVLWQVQKVEVLVANDLYDSVWAAPAPGKLKPSPLMQSLEKMELELTYTGHA